jgi:hypothetical protein
MTIEKSSKSKRSWRVRSRCQKSEAQIAKSTLELTIPSESDNNKKHLTPLGVNHQSERGVWHTGVGEK